MKPLQGKSVSIENTEDRPTKDNQRISKTPKAVFEDIVWHSVAAHDIIWYSDPAKLLRSCELLVWSFCTSLACSACGACGCRGCRSSNCRDTSSTWERRTSVWRRSSFALRTTRSNQVRCLSQSLQQLGYFCILISLVSLPSMKSKESRSWSFFRCF